MAIEVEIPEGVESATIEEVLVPEGDNIKEHQSILAKEPDKALAEDLALTIHPHPTLSETIKESAELFMSGAIYPLNNEEMKRYWQLCWGLL